MSEINEEINTIKNIIENFDKLITSLEKNEKKKNKLSQKTKKNFFCYVHTKLNRRRIIVFHQLFLIIHPFL